VGCDLLEFYPFPGIPTTIKTMGVHVTTIAYIRVLIIEIGSTIILMVVEAQGICIQRFKTLVNQHCDGKSQCSKGNTS